MKKIFTILAAAVISLSATAQTQTLAPIKFLDNWYVGVEGGVATKTLNNAWTKNLNPTVGARVGKWISPILGVQAEANIYLDQKAREQGGHVNNAMFAGDWKTGNHQQYHGDNMVKKLSLMGELTLNLSNLFGGYKGEPRTFELIGLAGVGVAHDFTPDADFEMNGEEDNQMLGKAGLDFTFNLGEKKAWQLFVEPAIIWDIADNDICDHKVDHQMNLNKSAFQLLVGLNYKFLTSNGTHNFALIDLADQALIDRLNGNVNDLRGELNGKDAEIARLKKALNDCEESKKNIKPTVMQTNIMPKVFFKCNKWDVEKSQVANIDMVAEYMKANPNAKVLCKGYASVEGQADHNVDLSVNRANVVRDMLINKYGIDPSRLTAEGCGATDEHSSVLDFNRVTTFHDVTNK